MHIIKGNNYDYFWIETSSEFKSIGDFILDYSQFILNKNLAIISFDSDSFVPTDDEIKRGWTYKNEIAYFNNLNAEEFKGPIYDIYDQWFIFDYPTEIGVIDIFVNYSGFSLDTNSKGRDPLQISVTNKFWEKIKQTKPSRFLLCGDNFIYGSILKMEIDKIETAWC